MKKLIVSLVSVIVLVAIALSLVACGGQKFSGTYQDELGVTKLEFSGRNKVTYSSEAGGVSNSASGTYKVDGNTVTCTFKGDGAEELEFTYDEDADTFTLGGLVTYKKVK